MHDSDDYANEDRSAGEGSPPVIPQAAPADAVGPLGEVAKGKLFAEALLRSPLEELEALFEKRRRGFEDSSSGEQLGRLERSYALAREALESSMESGDGVLEIARDRAASAEASQGSDATIEAGVAAIEAGEFFIEADDESADESTTPEVSDEPEETGA